jgi:Protein of unknown function (DUF2786)
MNEAIIDKLRKLINHEKSARSIGSIAEAEIFAEKVQELLDQYNLSLSDIDMTEVRQTTGRTDVDLKVRHRWQHILATEIGKLNGCLIVGAGVNGSMVIGSRIDRLIVIEIWEYFESLCRALADRYMKEYRSSLVYRLKRKKHFHSRRARFSFCLGFAVTLARRLKAKHEADLAASQTSTALVFIGDKLMDAQDWVDDNLRIVESAWPRIGRRNIHDDAYERGVAMGNTVALTTKTVASNPAKNLC